MKRKVLITGATGDTGRTAVVAAIRRGLDVRAMVHKKDDRSGALEKAGAEVVVADILSLDETRRAMEGIDAAYFVYPVHPALINATVSFAQAAKEAGVKAVINLSQRSASRTSTSQSCQDSWVAEQVMNWSGLPVTHLRPTLFLEWLLYPWQLPLLRTEGVLRMPMGKGRHAPLASEDTGRVVAALLDKPEGHAGQTYPLFGPAEMDHEQMAAELTVALGRKIVFHDISIADYASSLQQMGLPPYVIQHFEGAMLDYQHGVMSGMNDNVERFSGQKPMTVTQFAKKHATELQP